MVEISIERFVEIHKRLESRSEINIRGRVYILYQLTVYVPLHIIPKMIIPRNWTWKKPKAVKIEILFFITVIVKFWLFFKDVIVPVSSRN